MTRWDRFLVAAALCAVVVAPLVTVHALSVHVRSMDAGRSASSLLDWGLLGLGVIAIAAIFPIAAATGGLLRSSLAAAALRQLSAGARHASFEDMPYRRVDSSEFAVFTAGLRRPTVYVTAGAEEALTGEMLRAALLHERAHVAANETRWRFLVVALERAFPGVSPVRRFCQRLIAMSELAADEQALRDGAAAGALFDALLAGSHSAASETSLGGGDVMIRLEHIVAPGLRDVPRSNGGMVAVAGWAMGLPLLAHVLVLGGLVCHSATLT